MGELEKAMTKDTSLVSIMTVNNEIGVVQPMKEIGELCRSKKVCLDVERYTGWGWWLVTGLG